MFGIFKRKKPAINDKNQTVANKPGSSMQIDIDLAKKLQTAYWTFDEAEFFQLHGQRLSDLSWADRLRLLHLVSMKVINEKTIKKAFNRKDIVPCDAPAGDTAELLIKFVTLLLEEESPYCARHLLIWQGAAGETETRPPDIQGMVRNASISHLGSLEIIRLDEKQQPVKLDFVAFDDLRGIGFAGQGLFRLARLFFDDGRPDEIVLVPLLYGISWASKNSHDKDGSFTRFLANVDIPNETQTSIGVGHQDLFANDKENSVLMGLGSLGEIMVALKTTDPRFKEKCQVRGLDPEEILKQMGE